MRASQVITLMPYKPFEIQCTIKLLQEATLFSAKVLHIWLQNCIANFRSRCVLCKKNIANIQAPLMANLPRKKVEKVDFSFTDFGFVWTLRGKYMRKKIKRWPCVFTCLSTRAIRLEMVYSLDKDSCLSSFTHFIATRGHALTIWSNNRTTFVGANNEPKQFASSRWQNTDFQEKFRQTKIVRKCNPAAAPHFRFF